MSDVAIAARGLAKQYHLRAYNSHTLADEVSSLWHRIRGRNPAEHMRRLDQPLRASDASDSFWALRDVSFDVAHGEVVGIIGRNGSGKSTLLKILTRITEPTAGEATIEGRVGALLEVGTGFHGELTGRENVYMSGTVLGMKKREIDAKFDEILDFSEMEAFIDTPVKRYSSGMCVRLAFAVAAHLDPEILLVDEVLAVGDAQFQRKCLGHMNRVARGGSTVLFVSHQMGAVAQLCSRVMLLRAGRVVGDGPTEDLIDRYLTDGAPSEGNAYARPVPETAPQAPTPCFHAARTVAEDGAPRQEYDWKSAVILDMDLDLPEIPTDMHVCVSLRDHFDRPLFTTERACEVLCGKPGAHRVRVALPPRLLAPGHYAFTLTLHIPNRRFVDCVQRACRFLIIDTGSEMVAYEGRNHGAFLVNCNWERLER